MKIESKAELQYEYFRRVRQDHINTTIRLDNAQFNHPRKAIKYEKEWFRKKSEVLLDMYCDAIVNQNPEN